MSQLDHETDTQGANSQEASDFGGIASFADAESREILNLLNMNDAAAPAEGGCCGGSCCS